MSNTLAICRLLPNSAFPSVLLRFSHCSTSLRQLFGIHSPSICRTLRQRLCELHVAASDSLETTTMATENITAENLALRPREAAKALGVSERSLWEWTHRGDVPHVRIGRTIMYPVDALRAWLNRQAGTAKGVEHEPR
jgi:excisionase family DNA binding protein